MPHATDFMAWREPDFADFLMTEGYVQEHIKTKQGEPTGVFISKGIDLGQLDERDLRALVLHKYIIDQIRPYAGLRGEQARAFLAENPLVMNQCDAFLLYLAVCSLRCEDLLVLSLKGQELLKQYEGYLEHPYDDRDSTRQRITSWVPQATIGWGHLISEKEWTKLRGGINKSQACVLFKQDLIKFEEIVNKTIAVPLKQHQFDALVILAYNIGDGEQGFAGSSVAKLINNPYDPEVNYSDLESAWKAWKYVKGKECRGLLNRRAKEWKLYTEGIYEPL